MNPSTPVRRPWTADERKKLDELINAGKTAPEIASALQRTPTSIYAQLQRLEIKKATRRLELGLKGEGEAKRPPVGTPTWTEAGDAKLRSLAVAGLSSREI